MSDFENIYKLEEISTVKLQQLDRSRTAVAVK